MTENLEIRFPARGRYLQSIRALLRTLLSDQKSPGLSAQDVSELQLALQEACINAVRHGSRGDGGDRVRVVFLLDEDRITVEVHDSGTGFDPTAVPAPDAEGLQEGGYGIFIIRETMDSVEWGRTEEGFVLSFTKVFVESPGPVWAVST